MEQRGQNSEYYILEFTRSNPDLDLVFLDGMIRILFNLGGRIRNWTRIRILGSNKCIWKKYSPDYLKTLGATAQR